MDSLQDENPGLVFYLFCRVVFGVNASPCLLNSIISCSQYEADPGLFENLFNSLYVDDLVTGKSGVEECLSLYQKIRLRSAHQRVALTCESGFQILPKVLELICEDQVGTVKTYALVEDTYLLLAEFSVRTVNYGPSFFPSILWPKREAFIIWLPPV